MKKLLPFFAFLVFASASAWASPCKWEGGLLIRKMALPQYSGKLYSLFVVDADGVGAEISIAASAELERQLSQFRSLDTLCVTDGTFTSGMTGPILTIKEFSR
jgi:hypothetical protein